MQSIDVNAEISYASQSKSGNCYTSSIPRVCFIYKKSMLRYLWYAFILIYKIVMFVIFCLHRIVIIGKVLLLGSHFINSLEGYIFVCANQAL